MEHWLNNADDLQEIVDEKLLALVEFLNRIDHKKVQL